MDPAKTKNCHNFRALGLQNVKLSLFLGPRPPKRETVANFRPGPSSDGRTDEPTAPGDSPGCAEK